MEPVDILRQGVGVALKIAGPLLVLSMLVRQISDLFVLIKALFEL